MVDQVVSQWGMEKPDLDLSPIEVMARIDRVSYHLDRELDRTYARFGLSHGGFEVLTALRRSGPPYQLTPTELFKETLSSSGAMTARIDRLETAGLVERLPDSSDRRAVQVQLTAAGSELIEKLVAVQLDTERQLLAVLSPHEQRLLRGLLRKLLGALEEMVD